VWLYAGGVSLILPDFRFGTFSQDWVKNVFSSTLTFALSCHETLKFSYLTDFSTG